MLNAPNRWRRPNHLAAIDPALVGESTAVTRREAPPARARARLDAADDDRLGRRSSSVAIGCGVRQSRYARGRYASSAAGVSIPSSANSRAGLAVPTPARLVEARSAVLPLRAHRGRRSSSPPISSSDDAAFGEHDEHVVEQVGDFPHELAAVAVLRRDHDLGRLLADLLRDAVDAAARRASRYSCLGRGARAAIRDRLRERDRARRTRRRVGAAASCARARRPRRSSSPRRYGMRGRRG